MSIVNILDFGIIWVDTQDLKCKQVVNHWPILLGLFVLKEAWIVNTLEVFHFTH